jgi:hypothetical protein
VEAAVVAAGEAAGIGAGQGAALEEAARSLVTSRLRMETRERRMRGMNEKYGKSDDVIWSSSYCDAAAKQEQIVTACCIQSIAASYACAEAEAPSQMRSVPCGSAAVGV